MQSQEKWKQNKSLLAVKNHFFLATNIFFYYFTKKHQVFTSTMFPKGSWSWRNHFLSPSSVSSDPHTPIPLRVVITDMTEEVWKGSSGLQIKIPPSNVSSAPSPDTPIPLRVVITYMTEAVWKGSSGLQIHKPPSNVSSAPPPPHSYTTACCHYIHDRRGVERVFRTANTKYTPPMSVLPPPIIPLRVVITNMTERCEKGLQDCKYINHPPMSVMLPPPTLPYHQSGQIAESGSQTRLPNTAVLPTMLCGWYVFNINLKLDFNPN